ncbi:MAG: alkaline phosphatase family protein [Mucilaginibacter polytrichastri]|nr:alkaline phosphatase family protein [Mucilaginibacter polytrichastri]
MKIKQICIALALSALAGAGQAQQKKAVFVIIDGVSRDILDKVETPNIHALAAQGGLINAAQGGETGQYNETPTISAPGYYNVLTGVWFNKHNVPDNDIKAPNYHYPTIFRLFKDKFPQKKTAVFSSWEDNRTKLIGEGLPQTKNLQLDHHFDGLELDTVKYPHDRAREFMAKIDQAVTDEAARYIAAEGPDLSWVYLEYTDDMGHMYGDSPKYFDAVKAADQRIGQIWSAIQKRQKENGEEWLMIVTTDHGRDPKTGKDHGGQSARERSSWIATNAKPLNAYAKSGKASVVDILPTIARFLDLPLSADEQRELDGVPLSGKVSVTAPRAVRKGDVIELSWTPVDTEGKVKISIADANGYNTTGTFDTFRKVAEVPVKSGRYTISLDGAKPSDFYKVVLEGKYNTVNRWVKP